MKIRYLFLIFNFSFFVCGAFAAENCADMARPPAAEQTLAQVIEMGLCRNPNTRAAYLSVISARDNKNAQYANYLPSVDASVSASKPFNGGQFGDISAGAGLSANWLIFDFGKRLADLNNMAAVWRATGFDYSSTTQNYVYDIIGAYYGLLSADAEVTASTELLSAAKQAKDTADKKFKAGAVAKADVLKAETNLASRELDLQRTTGAATIARGRLLSLLSFPQNSELKITQAAFESTRAESKNIDDLIAYAKKHRPDLMSAEAATDAARHRRNSAILRRLPSISAFGSLNYDIANEYANNDDKWSGSIGVRASMPIFAGFSHVYAERAAEMNYERAGELERAKQDSVALDVWTAYTNYQTAQTVLTQTDTLLKSAAETERVTRGMYNVGRATMLDLLTQQAELATAQKQNIAAKYDLFIKRAALALALGDLE